MESSADRPFLEEDMLSSPQPPQLPPRPVPGGQEGDEDEVDNGGNGCRCGAVDPVHMESAWEHMSALRANGGGPVRSGGIKSARVRVGATETLDLRIFCGTWNVAGEQCLVPVGRLNFFSGDMGVLVSAAFEWEVSAVGRSGASGDRKVGLG